MCEDKHLLRSAPAAKKRCLRRNKPMRAANLRCVPALAVCGALLSNVTCAQTPYAGMQSREIKALSDQQIADLRAGRGMGLALPAELNGYPGPAHLLELADQIGLSGEQRNAVSELFEAMKAETIPIGERLVDQERSLDQLLANHT